MDDVTTFLAAVDGESAKQRERVINGLTPLVLQHPLVIEALQRKVSADPVEYVREAARAKLLLTGQTPAPPLVPVQLKQEGNRGPLILLLTCVAIPLILIVCAIVVIAILAITGPQIGNIFSRVTNGLSGGTP